MQKEALPSDRNLKKSSSKCVVGNIFRTMAYNENQVENFSTILKWISSKKDTITSVINGEAVETSSCKENIFSVEQKIVSVASLDSKSLKSILLSVKSEETESSSAFEKGSWDEKGATERLRKFEELMKALIPDLAKAESIATGIPAWQITEFDQPTWDAQETRTDNGYFGNLRRILQCSGKESKTLHVLMRLRKDGYSLQSLLPVIRLAVQFERKFLLSISLSCKEDVSCVLPAAYLIDALNKTKIRKTGIDLLLLDDCDESVKILLKNPNTNEILWWNNVEACCHLPANILTGVVNPERTRSVHFIVDSSADVQSAVDSIAAETWSSGTRVNLRARSLLFVHQPIYRTVIEFLEKKISSLRISKDPTYKSTDFITRTLSVSIDLKKVLAQGVKAFPQSTDLQGPTIFYEIGTSTDLVANRVAGMGHFLCVIPYRSNTELLTLLNNQGPYAQTQIYASNSDVIKKVAGNIKGEEIWVNSSGKHNGEEGLSNINNWVFLQQQPTAGGESSEGKQRLVQTAKDEFGLLLEAEKSLKSWSAVGAEGKYSIGERVLFSALKNDSSIGESDRVRYLIDLMRITGQPFNNGHENYSENLRIYRTKPIGIVGIVLVNPKKISLPTLILPILLTTLKGNAAIVISISSPVPHSIVEACNSNFPVGLVNFINSSSVTDSFKTLSHQGKVSTVWILYGHGESSPIDQIPLRPFTTLILDHEDFILPSSSFVSSNKFVQTCKIIHW